jgi:hypothetical protein
MNFEIDILKFIACMTCNEFQNVTKPFQLGDNDSVSVDLSRSEAMSNAASDVIDKSSKVPHSRMNRKDMSKQ